MAGVTLPPAEVVIGPRVIPTAAVPTELSVLAAVSAQLEHVQLSIRETQHAPHRQLSRNLSQITASRPMVERAARRIVSVMHHLELALEHGATIRLRKVGTFRSAWNVDLLRSGAVVCSWPVKARTVDQLDLIDADLQRHIDDVPATQGLAALSGHMREIDTELQREHQVDKAIREHLDVPIEDLLALLDARGLLDPVESA